ncbi:MAG: hypothetical protein RL015_165 [Verrucomicrobiota bacterium]|jgi:hypothetical protein
MSWLYPTFSFRQFAWMFVFGMAGSVVAGSYGVIHDQITFSIGYEYFTEFKFHQFYYLDQGQPERLLVAEIGFLATWWVGMFAGWFMGRVTLPHWNVSHAARLSAQGMAIMALTALSFAVIAYMIAPETNEDPRMPYWRNLLTVSDVIDSVAFVRVGYIHNASYLGGLAGLIGSLFWLRKRRHQLIITKTAQALRTQCWQT